MKFILFIGLSTILLSFSAKAQDQHGTSGERSRTIDSLKQIIEKAKHDTSVCDAYLSWGEEVYKSNPDTALILFQKTHSIAKTQSANGHPPALHKKYLWFLSEALNNIGYIYNSQGDVPLALQYYHKSLKVHEEIEDENGIATSLNNIGYIHDNQGDIPKALEYYHKSLKIQEDMGNKSGVARSLNNIGLIYMKQEDFPKALECFHKCLKIDEDIGDKRGIASSLNNIGAIYMNQEDIPKALEYYHKSLKIKEETGNKKGIASSLKNIGRIELDQGRVTSALNYGLRGLEIAREIGSPQLISVHSSLLSKVAKKQGNYQEALEMYELHIQMRDSLKNEETQKSTIRQQTKYEFEKAQLVKEQEEKEAARIVAEETSRRDNLQYSVILIAILALFGGVLALGFINVSERMAEGLIFFSFLILFEFLLVLADPTIEGWSGGAPGIKLLFNAGIAALIFPAHAFFERMLKNRLVR